MKKTIIHVLLGRFSPLHFGHQKAINLMVNKYGVDECMVMVGSSNSRNDRTPFTFEQREKMIKSIFPNLKVIGLPDIQPELVIFDGSTNSAWLDSIEKIEHDLGVKFVFCGGNKADLSVLSERFETEIIFDRDLHPELTATHVRKALDERDDKKLKQLIDVRILAQVIDNYQVYLQSKI